ncbi:MAG: FAD-dependent oxidoreductase [Planctomycetes bacterium]|nr:FAD-dependent oxidoreductase [Planctomycetota bacterium]
MASLWIEAESFTRLGGWIIDQQSMDEMGSAYVMAHGLGEPVADAATAMAVAEAGTYRVWVRTRNWTARWGRGRPGGTFQVLVDGRALPEVLGTGAPDWAWQLAGTVELAAGTVPLALHDLTGFNARCDALWLTTDPVARPPEGGAELAAFRSAQAGIAVVDEPQVFDLAVAGGGIAGTCAALAALATGARVLLVHDRAVLGGCNSSEVRVGLGGGLGFAPFPELGRVVREISPVMGGFATYEAELFEDARKAAAFRRHGPEHCRLALEERVVAVERDPGDPRRIAAIVTRQVRTGAERRYRAALFADCTGDATLARRLGATVRYGREARAEHGESLAPLVADRQVMGMSVQWTSAEAAGESPFPDLDWGLPWDESRAYHVRGGDWEWEAGQFRDMAAESEEIRDYALMALFANWSWLKNHSPRRAEYARARLTWASPLGGKRESYRVEGDLVLTQGDIEGRIPHPDGTACASWDFDLHSPDPENRARFPEPFRSCAYHRGIGAPYPVPYRCLYARDVANLFLGGRIVSATHVAFACLRVQRTLGMLGEVVGLAAALCAERGLLPRDLSGDGFSLLAPRLAAGVPQPLYHSYPCDRSEKYHFKELGMIPVRDGQVEADPATLRRIASLAVVHRGTAADG